MLRVGNVDARRLFCGNALVYLAPIDRKQARQVPQEIDSSAEQDEGLVRRDAGVVSVSALEADVAYFDARLSLLDEVPATRYQSAAIKAYQTLERLLADRLAGLGAGQKSGRRDVE